MKTLKMSDLVGLECFANNRVGIISLVKPEERNISFFDDNDYCFRANDGGRWTLDDSGCADLERLDPSYNLQSYRDDDGVHEWNIFVEKEKSINKILFLSLEDGKIILNFEENLPINSHIIVLKEIATEEDYIFANVAIDGWHMLSDLIDLGVDNGT